MSIASNLADATASAAASLSKLDQLARERGLDNDHTWLKARMFLRDAQDEIAKAARAIGAAGVP